MSRIWIRIIAVLEIVGGAFGILFIVLQFVAGENDRLALVLALVSLAVYLLSFVAGVALWRGHRFGRVGSIAVQAIQLPKYGSQLFFFMFSFGFDAYPYFALTNTANTIVGFEFKLLAFNQLFVNVADAPVVFGVSIPACIFLSMLLKHQARVVATDEPVTGTQVIGPEHEQDD
jgi:hypothetical protein